MKIKCQQPREAAQAGFTIIELLIAMIIVSMVTGIVYSTFTSVLASTETATIASEQLYTQTFVTRHITQHASQASPGWQPGALYRPYSTPSTPVNQVMGNTLFSFVGVEDGEEDSLTFTTSVPMNGPGGLPGYFTQVKYALVEGDSIEMPDGSPYVGQAMEGPVLLVTEVPILSYDGINEGDLMADRVTAFKSHAESLEISTPLWVFPVQGLNIEYHDGEDWVDGWDLELKERLPWAIRMTILWRPWETDGVESREKDPDNQFELVVIVPGGVGILNATPAYGRPEVSS